MEKIHVDCTREMEHKRWIVSIAYKPISLRLKSEVGTIQTYSCDGDTQPYTVHSMYVKGDELSLLDLTDHFNTLLTEKYRDQQLEKMKEITGMPDLKWEEDPNEMVGEYESTDR